VEGSETTFELVYWAAVNDVRHGLGGSTDAQWLELDVLGVSWKINLPSSSPEVFCGRRCVDGPYWPAVWQTRHWMVEDVLVNRNMRFSLEIMD